MMIPERPVWRCTVLVLVTVMLGAAVPASARVIKGDSAQCLAKFVGFPGNENGGVVQCNDCDPNCDHDGVDTPNNSCTFNLQICLNQAGGPCAPGAFKQFKVKKSGKCSLGFLKPPPDGIR